jgi:hypothetical protein
MAKVSNQLPPSTSVKVAEKKKKKEKKQGEESTKGQQDDVVQNTHTRASDAVEGPEKPKDKKKKRKLKKINSTSTGTAPEVSTPEPPLNEPQGANNDTHQNPPQEKVSGHNNESSNSCLQPPSVKVF